MTKEQITEKYGVEFIAREMWVWDYAPENAFLWLVMYKNPKAQFPYITIDKYGDKDFFRHASETDPNEPQEPQKPKVGDVGYFWDDKECGYAYAYGVLDEIDNTDLPFISNYFGTCFHNFSHDKQPWMQ